MRGKGDADWKQLVESWKAQQNELRRRMVVRPLKALPRFVAGADAAFSADKKNVFAAAVVYDRQEQRIIEVVHAIEELDVPYVPGFLSLHTNGVSSASTGRALLIRGAAGWRRIWR